MSVNLSDLFYQSGVKPNPASKTENSGTVKEPARGQSALQPGQQFRGTVVAVNGDRVTIQTSDHSVFNARLENGMRLEPGAMLDFEVRSIQNGQISLTPLYSNLRGDSSILRALQAADLPMSDRAYQMVNEMMNQGMSIDSKSLHSMFHLISQYENTSPQSLVQMNQLQIPFTEENIAQFEIFKNNEMQITEGFREIGNELLSLMRDMADSQDFAGLGRLFLHVMQAVAEEDLLSDSLLQTDSPAVNPGAVQAGAAGEVLPDGTMTTQPEEGAQTGVESGTVPADVSANTNGQEIVDDLLLSTAEGSVRLSAEKPLETEAATQNTADTAQASDGNRQVSDMQETGRNSAADLLLEALKEAGRSSDSEMVKENPAQNGNPAPADSSQISPDAQTRNEDEAFDQFLKDFLPRLKDASSASPMLYREAGEQLARLMELPMFEERFQKALSDQWRLKPQDVASKEAVQKLYEKVLRQTAELEQVLAQSGKSDSAAMKSVQNMAREVEFLNDINHTFAFLQLPLKMGDQNAHGDLYVYRNKRGFGADDGTVTALLHLSMEHLGNLDIYVAMANHKVNTKFYLESDELIDFLEGHMEELDRRLIGKGYALRSEVLHKDHKETGNILEEMLADSRISGKTPMAMMSRQSFDVRA